MPKSGALLDNYYDRVHATNIQALLLLSIREYGTTRMAQSLGMHRNNEKWHPTTLSHGEKEEQKRIFCAYVLDSVHLGRPLAIVEKDVDAAHPSENKDDEYEPFPFKMEHATNLISSPDITNNKTSIQVNKKSKKHGESSHIMSRFNCL
ncbi:32189_t:CDS:2 [Racocetra persica]|uniref:32189_t:CDS:1 n=1 Tax=Racocetra persica TaxID=160502 RepID=A0ACA9NA01_9GLOM|nr:32189_t:CDS:2 [Racocetra persica]